MEAGVEPSATTAPRGTAEHYDAIRDLYYSKPRMRGWVHLICFEIALVIGTLTIADAHGARETSVAAIYAAAVAGLFGASALYHRGKWGPLASRRLQRLDHLMIILLIAGTATPAVVMSMHGTAQIAELALLGTFAAATATVRLLWMNAPEKIVGVLYIGLGWVAGAAVPAVWIHNGTAPGVLLLVGGLLYTLGAVMYHRRRPDPRPAVFGYHEVFHTFVSLAAACQYIAIACFVL
jgi:hemolysin III